MEHEKHLSTSDTSNERPKIAILLSPAMRARVLPTSAERQLASFASVVSVEGTELNARELPDLLTGAVACLTGWGTPPLSAELLAGQTELRLVAHTAGSIRQLLPLSALEGGLRVSHAAAIIAQAVAEFIIAQAIAGLRHLHEIDQGMKAGQSWSNLRETYPGALLGCKTVGVVGTGRVGRAVIRLLKAFGSHVLANDPYLTTEQAKQLGVETMDLDDLLAEADIVTLHAPVLAETTGMINARRLALLRDNAIFINAARASLVDEAALLRELTSGRISAVLDVFAQEPLPLKSPLRTLPNVFLSPHTAGHTQDTHLQQGQAMVDEIQRFLRGEPLHYEISAAIYPTLA